MRDMEKKRKEEEAKNKPQHSTPSNEILKKILNETKAAASSPTKH